MGNVTDGGCGSMRNIGPEWPESSDFSGGSFFVGRRKLIVGVILVGLALGYFVFTAFQGSAVYYLTVGEVLAGERATDNQTLRVSGKLLPESFQREPGTTFAHFTLTDGENKLPATYDGVLPDLFFNGHSEVILQGQYEADGVFGTDTVLVKCPSKYSAEEETA